VNCSIIISKPYT